MTRKWWDKVRADGPQAGYHPNAFKSVLIVKPYLYDNAVDLFRGTDIKITKEGQRHLGAVIGSEEFVSEYVRGKVNE